jgi:hypothetical protein
MSSEESERILTPQLSAHMFALAGRRQIQFGDGFRRLLTNEWRRRGDWGGGRGDSHLCEPKSEAERDPQTPSYEVVQDNESKVCVT